MIPSVRSVSRLISASLLLVCLPPTPAIGQSERPGLLAPSGSVLLVELSSGVTARGLALEPVVDRIVLRERGVLSPSRTFHFREVGALFSRKRTRWLEGLGIGTAIGFLGGELWLRSACGSRGDRCTSHPQTRARRSALTFLGALMGVLAGKAYPVWEPIPLPVR